MTADPFGTAAMRRRVLDAWAASPARFREDANAEEDLVLGGYRDRVVVELAQNAADAAGRAGVPGRLHLRLYAGTLVASNVGSPLDAAGVESLSTLRASAKRDEAGTAGRFGVGFAAVLALTDEPAIASSDGSVRWSANDARADLRALHTLADELAERRGHLPALRLPYADDARPEQGWDTTVRLPLRDAAAEALARRLLDEVDDALLLALPALTEIVVEVDGQARRLTGADRWQVLRRGGSLDPALLADRPVEERARPWWSLTWAVPTAGQPVPRVLHAPTPTDEPVDLPALLVCSFPLDPTRRHVAAGPLTDFLVAEAAGAYAELAAGTDDPVAMVPGVVAAGALDAALRRAMTGALSTAPILRTIGGEHVRPRDAVSVVDAGGRLRAVLDEVLAPLVEDRPELARLGTRRLPLHEVVDMLADLHRGPAWWRALYAGLGDAVTREARDALGAVPVPLADGRTVRGPRGLLMPGDRLPAGLDVLGLRVVHPDAAHPLLLRLGAVDVGARAVLADPAVRAAVEAAEDAPEAPGLVEAVLGLVAAAGVEPGALPWLGDLLLPDDAGELVPARDLALPGSLLDEVADDGVLGRPSGELVDRWGRDVLAAVGVLAIFGVVRDEDVSLEDTDHDLDAEADWAAHLLADLPPQRLPPSLPELLAVRDLDVVRDDAWPQVLAVLAGDPQLRAAVVEPARVLTGSGRVDAPSYTAWWLRRNARLGGRRPDGLVAAGTSDLRSLYDEVTSDLDPVFLSALGVRTSLAALLAEPGGPDELLDRMADPGRPVSAAALSRLYAALAALDPDDVEPPERVRVGPDLVVDAAEVVVLDAPQHLQLAWPVPPLRAPLETAAALADVLGVDVSSDRVGDVAPPAGGRRRTVASVVARVLPGAPDTWREHDDLVVGGVAVQWWVGPDGTVHACTVDGLARGLSWAAGRWDLRLLVAAVLADPARVDDLLAEASLETPPPGDRVVDPA